MASQEAVQVTIPSLADMNVTRSNVVPPLCASCRAVEYTLEAAGEALPDATELHARCEPISGSIDAKVAVTAVHSEGANTLLPQKTIFCLVARQNLMGNIPQER